MEGSASQNPAPEVTAGSGEDTRSALDARIDSEIAVAAEALRNDQAEDGHWAYELEADATIPAELILLHHFMGEIDTELEAKLARYLRRTQSEQHGGWPLYRDGDFNISASVKSYFALKLAGDDPEAQHMTRARDAILAHGGAARSNVFTRISLALFGQVPWRAVPAMPIGIMLLPRWSPFHISKVSYWSRTVIVPLLILMAEKPRAANPNNIDIRELFTVAPERERRYLVNPTKEPLGYAFLALDNVVRRIEPLFPAKWKRSATDRAVAFITERLNGDNGLGGIFPAMTNALMALRSLGYADDHPDVQTAWSAVRKLVIAEDGEARCQPCLSPVWDTALAMQALHETGETPDSPGLKKAGEWLRSLQITSSEGDWTIARPDVEPGGWPFQYRNDFYPDVDDTAVVGMALDRINPDTYADAIRCAGDWLVGMQSRKGGWGSFDADNTHYYLNHIPFADHGALLDPPTADVSARCVSFLAQIGFDRNHPAMIDAMDYLRGEQEMDGSWFGRWGTNYVYGTWAVLSAFNAAGVSPDDPAIRQAVTWLESRQRDDGGWGESGATYWPDRRFEQAPYSTATQTAWALLGLMAAGEKDSDTVRRGIEFLLGAPRRDGKWEEHHHNAVGFPRVFYLLYHGYPAYFPLWALARYRRLRDGNATSTGWGM